MSFDAYDEYDALGLAALVQRGEVGPEELLDEALERAADHNPRLNAIVHDMEKWARESIAAGLPQGPFRGVPFLLKDLAAHYAGVPTSGGSRFFADFVPDHDSDLVRRYKAAGLVCFGKSATPEFGLTTTTESVLFGATRNPWNLEHTTGGSSGGAAAAVAVGILPIAHASDGGGSIRIPASCCGLFGLKPSRGRVPFGPDVGESWSGMSTQHAVSRSVRDSAALLDASDGIDLGAPYWPKPKERPYVDEVGRDPGRLRVALLRETFNGTPTHADCRSAVDDAARLCESLGHHVEEARLEIERDAFGRATACIIAANLLDALEERAEALGRPFGREDIEPFTYTMSELVRSRDASVYARSIRTIHALGRQVEGFLQDYDLILTPTLGLPPARIGVLSLSNPDVVELTTNVTNSVGYTQLFNASGHPAMSVPLWWNEAGLPIGVQFAARLGDEGALFRMAGQLEAARPWWDRRPPPA